MLNKRVQSRGTHCKAWQMAPSAMRIRVMSQKTHNKCRHGSQVWGSNQQIYDSIKDLLHEMEPMASSDFLAKNLRQDGPETRGNQNTTVLQKESTNKMTPNDLLLYS